MDARLMNSKEYGHLNSDLNSFRSNENDSYHNQNQQLSDNAAGPQQYQLYESTVDSNVNVGDSIGKMPTTITNQNVINITRNRNYMHSDVGTTIIENEKGEEQSQQNDTNIAKYSEEKDITMMDKQLRIKDGSGIDYGIQSYNSSSKLMNGAETTNNTQQ